MFFTMDEWLQSDFMHNVFRPLLDMFGVEEVKNMPAPMVRNNRDYSNRLGDAVVEYMETGGPLPYLSAKPEAVEWAISYRNCLTITLREVLHQSYRNSSLSDWVLAADAMEEPVYFVRDTRKAFDPIEGHKICPEASLDLHKRLALYRVAKMNFFVGNGPCGLPMATQDIPYVIFQTKGVQESILPDYTAPDGSRVSGYAVWMGFQWGQQVPWHNPKIQRLVYADDNYENIIEAYRHWKEHC
jgi:hypothetical protein